jgi:hypothetical protein
MSVTPSVTPPVLRLYRSRDTTVKRTYRELARKISFYMKCVIFMYQSSWVVLQSEPEHAAMNNTCRLNTVSKISVDISPGLYEVWRSASTTEIMIRASCILTDILRGFT